MVIIHHHISKRDFVNALFILANELAVKYDFVIYSTVKQTIKMTQQRCIKDALLGLII
jgi:hypothetical protein